MKQPAFLLYIGDWKRDPALSICSPATRGIWIDFVCSMWDAKVDRVSGTAQDLSRLCRCSEGEMVDAVHELALKNAADIEEQNGFFTVICRRLRKQQELSKIRAKSGAKAKQSERMPENEDEEGTLRVLREYAVKLGLPESDGEACFHKWQGNGWTNGGEPIRDWRSTMQSWMRFGYLPSQKRSSNGSKPWSKGEAKSEHDAAIERRIELTRERMANQ